MVITHNIGALNTYYRLGSNERKTSGVLVKLSSGLRINSAADDAAGLAISEKMRGQIRGLGQAAKNAQDGISLIQTAEGSLNETHGILQRMRELAVQASSDTYTGNDRAAIQLEIDQLTQEISNIADKTTFNTRKLLNGDLSGASGSPLVFQIGANASQTMALTIDAMDAVALGVSAAAGSTTTATGTVTGGTSNLATATFSGGLGSKITNGANLTFTYSANTVTISDGTPADDQSIAVNATDTSFTVNSGNYQGMTVTLAAGKTVSDLTGSDGVSIASSASTTGTVTGGTSGATTLVKTDGANITSTGIPAYAADGVDITLTYAPGTPLVPGQQANFVSSQLYTSDLTTALSPSSNLNLTITEDGLTIASIAAVTLQGSYIQTGLDMYNTVNFWANATMRPLIWKDSSSQTWGFISGGAGALCSVVVNITGGTAAERSAVGALFGMSGNSKTVNGTDFVPAGLPTLTLADNIGHSQTYTVTQTDTAFTAWGWFNGLAINLASGKTVSDLDGSAASSISFNNVTTPATPANVASVAFGSNLGGKITNGAALTFTYSAGNVTIHNGTPADDQTVAVNASDTSFTVSSGNYKGMTVNLASGKTVSDLTSTDGVTISQSISATGAVSGATGPLASVSFAGTLGGKITNGANLAFTYGAGNVTISNGTPADDQTIAVNAADTSFTVSSGNYKGMTVNLASGKTVSDLTSGSDGALISLSSSSGGGIDISTQAGADAAISVIDNAISLVSRERSNLGSMQNRLEHTINNLSTTNENLTAAESRIRDADMAQQMMEYTKVSILAQAATAMLAQANQAPQSVLQLLRPA